MTPAEIDQIAEAVEKRVVDAVEKRLKPRFDAIDRRFDQILDLLQAMATGHAQRFDSVERSLDRLDQRVAGLERERVH